MEAIKKLFKDDKSEKTVHKEENREVECHVAKTTNLAPTPQIAQLDTKHIEKTNLQAQQLEQEANRLREEAIRKIEASEKTFESAQMAQSEVERAATRANIITNQALKQEVAGQRTMVEAGHKMMEAGAKLQEEAAQLGQAHQAEINIVQKGQINQSVGVEVPNIPASEMHILQNRVVSECRPMVETQVCTEKIGTEAHMRQGYAK